ncbi:2-dehydro-3-deoxygalactonokinase [Roseinatronobacter alkalisoli]|uniref:2-dehydro-3-deoxygalactonokinase n=1 Tax=Roseinatronobacter alkalisoli TaxID=3028235 RepID=A0ABT5T9D9_9RHOB|nr:2-dehydro-3-deoxygalactonokinase [Roseinatronobacter sp. HJB301]MDD7970996.1 2-dehydro-3-deoxygalactonokinase [Roseinatronobacter sp. HJB301]
MSVVDWIAADWGTSHLRVWGFADETVVHAAQSEQGMGVLSRGQFEDALLTLTEDWLPEGRITPVVACGMVGSLQGWVEAPYRAVPCPPAGGGLVIAPARDLRLQVAVVPGLKQARPADVMRGEETQVAGFMARNPGWDGVICLPGTHSKWVHVSAGEVVSFQTFMTGEMFALLSRHSVLRHSVSGWEQAGFIQGLDQGMERPEWLMSRLFSIRAEGLLQGSDPAMARARLSGLLIGAELAAAKPYWLGQPVAVIGADELAQSYQEALERLSVPVTTHDATAMTLAGLSLARGHLPEGNPSCVN